MKVTRFSKITVMLNCAVPVILLGWDAWNGNLGANPVNFAILTTGLLTLIFLILTLAITPVSRLARWSWLGQFRRMFGLCAFFHASLHFLLFFGLDRGANVVDTFSEMVKRPYLVVGTLALVLMVPLAVTSTDSMIRRLGGKRWKRLHRLIYVVAAAGVLHFYMLVKADVSRPVAFGVAIGILLGYRLLAHYWQLSSDSRKLRSATAVALDSHRVAAPGAKPRFWKGQMKVARVFEETPEVRTFRLVPTDRFRAPLRLPARAIPQPLAFDRRQESESLVHHRFFAHPRGLLRADGQAGRAWSVSHDTCTMPSVRGTWSTSLHRRADSLSRASRPKSSSWSRAGSASRR